MKNFVLYYNILFFLPLNELEIENFEIVILFDFNLKKYMIIPNTIYKS